MMSNASETIRPWKKDGNFEQLLWGEEALQILYMQDSSLGWTEAWWKNCTDYFWFCLDNSTPLAPHFDCSFRDKIDVNTAGGLHKVVKQRCGGERLQSGPTGPYCHLGRVSACTQRRLSCVGHGLASLCQQLTQWGNAVLDHWSHDTISDCRHDPLLHLNSVSWACCVTAVEAGWIRRQFVRPVPKVQVSDLGVHSVQSHTTSRINMYVQVPLSTVQSTWTPKITVVCVTMWSLFW